MSSGSMHRAALLVLAAIALSSPRANAGNHAWTTGGPFAKSIQALAVHPVKQNIRYAGAFGLGVYKSTDGGLTWAQHREGLVNGFVRSLAIDPQFPDTLYAGTNDGLYVSRDGDSTWVRLLATTSSVRAVALDRLHPGTIYAGTFSTGAFKSVDNGAHWTPINLGLTNTSVRTFAIHPTATDTIFAGTGTGGGIFRSNDGGLSWTQSTDKTASDGGDEEIIYDPLNPLRLYVATTGRGVIKSSDGGVTWVSINRGLTSFVTRAIAAADTFRFVGTDSNGVYYTTISDTSWHPIDNGLTNQKCDALLAMSKTDVWVGTDGGGIFHSVNSGGLWTQIGGNILLTDILALDVSADASRVYSGAGLGDQFWSSSTQGVSWAPTLSLAHHSSERALAHDAVSASTLYMALFSNGVWKSADFGATWTDPDLGASLTNLNVRALVAHPVKAGVLYTGADDGVYKSINGGASWVPVKAGLPGNAHVHALGLNPLKPDTVYAGTDSLGLYVTLNGGTTWSHVGAGISSVFVHSIVCDPSISGTVYAATDSGVFKSTGNGATWTQLNTGLPAAPSVRGLAVDATHPNVWFAGVWQAGVYTSGDNGAHWTQLPGVSSINVHSVAVDALHNTVYAGTEAGTSQYTGYPLTVVGIGSGPGRVASLVVTASPNPARTGVVLRFSESTRSKVTVEIFDVGGRRVRSLLHGTEVPPGLQEIRWDGRTDGGEPASSGVYMARVGDGSGARTARLVLVR